MCAVHYIYNILKRAENILNKWIGQCIDWCYARYEDGKFGDQKYLDKWPDDYTNVHILEHREGVWLHGMSGNINLLYNGKSGDQDQKGKIANLK